MKCKLQKNTDGRIVVVIPLSVLHVLGWDDLDMELTLDVAYSRLIIERADVSPTKVVMPSPTAQGVA